MEVDKGFFPNSVSVLSTPEGTDSIQFTATESTRYMISVATRHSSTNSGPELGDYTITVTSNAPVQQASLSAIVLNPNSVKGGTTATGTVSLSAPAPTGGALISLSSNNAEVRVPASVVIPQGSTTAQFSISTTRTRKNTTTTISASYAGSSKSAGLTTTR